MKQFYLFSIGLILCSFSFAQNVGIGTSTPDPSAKLEVNSTNSGVLVPRVALVATNNGVVPIASPATSLLVYNTATAGVAPNDVTPGFYYWDGYWVRLSTGSASNDWTINGNSGTIDGTNFIGTTDNVPFTVKVNNIRSGKIDQNTGNTSWGFSAIQNNGGTNSVAVGDRVFSGLYGASYNVGVGYQAMKNTTTGGYNVAVGSNALLNNLTGGSNVAVGYNALTFHSNGTSNTAIGVQSMENMNFGDGNTALGYNSLRSSFGGQYNTAIGAGASMMATSGNNNTSVGYLSASSVGGSDNTVVGYQSMPNNTPGTRNTALGSETLFNQTSSNDNTAIGYRSQYTGNASGNTSVGAYSINTNTSGENNTAVGQNAQYFTTTGSRNVSVGKDALYNLYSGYDNTAIGTGALTSNYNSPVENTAVGAGALQVASNSMTGGGTANTAVGFNANLGGGSGNTSLGHLAMGQGGGGQNNVAVGKNALLKETGNENIAIGKDALKENLSGNRNIAIGLEAGINSPGSNNIFIGRQAGFWEYGNDKLHIGNLSSPGLIYGDLANGLFGINTTYAEESMTVAGNLQIGFNNGIGSAPGELQFEAVGGYEASFKPSAAMTENTTYTLPVDGGTNGDVLITDGSGQLSWLTPNMIDSDNQTLGISGNTISISNGNSITLPASNAWNLTGNGSTVAGTNFIGTTDAVDFVTKTNGSERMRITSSGNVGVGTNSPSSSAKFDITSTNSGLLIPRVSLVQVDNGTTPISSPSTSLMVYNTNALMIGGQGTGFYYWNGSEWEKLYSGSYPTFWSLGGNALTTPGTDYLGTSDATDFILSTDGNERMRISANGDIGIGTPTPAFPLHVVHDSAPVDDRAIQVDYITSSNGGSYNSGIFVDAAGSGSSDLFGIHSYTSTTGSGSASSVIGILNSTGGAGSKIAIASQLGGSGYQGAGLSSHVTGNWTDEAYGLLTDVSASATGNTYGLYVKGSPDYSGFMESGNFYVNDKVAIGVDADPPQAKLHVDGNIKSTFLAGTPQNRILYSDINGQITPLTNGSPGDVLTINNSNEPEWSQSFGPKIHFAHLTSPFTYSGGGNDLVISKSFEPLNDTVIVQFNMSGNNSSLSTYEFFVYVNGSPVYKAYAEGENKINVTISVPVEVSPGSTNTIEVFVEDIQNNKNLDVDTFNSENANLIIYDMVTNE